MPRPVGVAGVVAALSVTSDLVRGHQLEDGLVRSVDQFIGDPPTVTEFWA